MSRKRRIAICLGLVVLLLSAALLAVVATEPGTRFALSLGSSFVPEGIKFRFVAGTLATGLALSDLEVKQAEGFEARARKASFSWHPSALLKRRVLVTRLELEGVTVRLPEDSAPEQAFVLDIRGLELPQLALPVSIEVRSVSVDEALIESPASVRRIRRLRLAFRADADAMQVDGLEMQLDDLQIEAGARLTPSGTWPLEAKAAVGGSFADVPLTARVRASGALERLVVELVQEQPFSANATGTLRLLAAAPSVDLAIRWRDARWPLAGGPDATRASGSFDVSGNQDAFKFTTDVRFEAGPAPFSRVTAEGGGAVGRTPELALRGDLGWTARLRTQDLKLTGKGTLGGSASAIRFEHTLVSPFAFTAKGSVEPAGDATRIDIAGDWSKLPFSLDAAKGASSPTGSYGIKGGLADLKVRIEGKLKGIEGLSGAAINTTLALDPKPPHAFKSRFNWRLATAPEGQVTGEGTVSGDRSAITVEHLVRQPFALTTRGRIELGERVSIDLSGDWRDLRWPLGGKSLYRSVRGSYHAKGPADRIVLQMDADTAASGYPDARITLDATAGPGEMNPLRINVQTMGGEILASGRAGWAPTPTWSLDVEARGLDPSKLNPEVTGVLNARIESRGNVRPKGLEAEARIERLDGNLRGFPVKGSGRFRLAGNRLEVTDLDLATGNNRVQVNGTVADEIDARYEIRARALEQVWPGLAGTLEGTGQVKGARATPGISAGLTGRGLRFADSRITRVDAKLELNPFSSSASRIDFELRDARLPGLAVARATFTGRGTMESHTLEFMARTDHGSVDTRVSAGLAELKGGKHVWRATIGRLTLEKTELGTWAMAAPTALAAGPEGGYLERLCLAQSEAAVCAQARWRTSALESARFDLEGVPLALARKWLPEQMALSGTIAGEGELANPGGILNGRATLRLLGAAMVLETEGQGAPLRIEFEDTVAEAALVNKALDATLNSRLSDGGFLRAKSAIGAPDARGVRTVQANLGAELPDIRPFASLIPGVANPSGRLSADARIGGSIERPRIEGNIALANASAQVPALGIAIEQGTLEARNSGDERLQIAGSMQLGKGTLDISGALTLDPATGWPLDLALKGERLQVARLPQAQVFASPDLAISINPQRIKVRGKVVVPEAHIEIKELPPGAVKISSDEIIVGRDAPAKKVPSGPALDVEVSVVIGDEVNFKAFGLQTKLAGALDVIQNARTIPSAQGTLELRGGRYRAYGQDLTIERGQLRFAGPIDNPGLDVRATRKAGDVTAGIRVRGSAARVESSIYSEPPLPEAEALSYLLTGRGLGGASKADGAMLANAAISLGLERSQLLTQQIAGGLGLDEFSVGGGDSIDQAALVMGKALTPQLYIRYALGLLDGEGTVHLEYKLTDHLSIEAESGARQGADLLYRIER